MSNVCEDSCPWAYLVETINKFTFELGKLLSTTFGLTFQPKSIGIFDDESLQKFSELFNELVALLSFDDFQLELLKIFLFTLISCVALIYVAWHIYGSRISEQFMKSSSPIGHCSSSSG